MDTSLLEKEEKLIRQSIRRKYDKSNDNAAPLYDGVVDAEKYLSAKPKICWILKEPYDSDYPAYEGGGWSIVKDYLGQDKDKLAPQLQASQTWRRITYVTYSILNKFLAYSKLSNIKEKPEMADALREIAAINVSKMPATSTSKDAAIKKKYEFWKPVLLRQLKSYDPQILIFGNTFKHFRVDLEIDDAEMKGDPKLYYVLKNNKLYLNAYHPGVRGYTISEGDYCQGLIDVVKKNIKKLQLF
ncbi:hypothetical protein AGMMS49942_09220 [Spirochaetia bacterium]|nr:hypothetical protein AGMMS49942_09220 [Spirochaetia bacterium]